MLKLALTKVKTPGFVLLEVVLAFGVSLIIIAGMIALGVTAVRATTTNKAYAEAGKVAQREVERLRLLRDSSSDWDSFKDAVDPCAGSGRCYLYFYTPWNSYVVRSGEGTEGTGSSAINYYFSITSSSDDMVKYVVTARWTVGAAPEKTYTIEGALSDWGEN